MDFGWIDALTGLFSSIAAVAQLIIVGICIVGTIHCIKEERYLGAAFCACIAIVVYLKMAVV